MSIWKYKAKVTGVGGEMTESEGKKQLKDAESKAKTYIEDPEKMKKLIQDGTKKADRLKGPLEEAFLQLKTLFSMLKDYMNGSYRVIPSGSLLVIIGAIIYFVSPLDFIPDFLPGGLIDDALVIGLAVRQVKADIDKYRVWKEM